LTVKVVRRTLAHPFLGGLASTSLSRTRPPLFSPQYQEESMADRFNELQGFVNDLERDFQQFYQKGNKAAGTRVRKGMQELKKMAQDIRNEVQEKKNDM
jgi:hypothetical protein